MKITTIAMAVALVIGLSGCSLIGENKESYKLLHQVHKAERGMKVAKVEIASGTALAAKGTVDHAKAKQARDEALEALGEELELEE